MVYGVQCTVDELSTSHGLGNRKRIAVNAYLLSAGYKVRTVVVELHKKYVSRKFWFYKRFVYMTDIFQWLSEFR